MKIGVAIAFLGAIASFAGHELGWGWGNYRRDDFVARRCAFRMEALMSAKFLVFESGHRLVEIKDFGANRTTARKVSQNI
jgi:hypothetical protein